MCEEDHCCIPGCNTGANSHGLVLHQTTFTVTVVWEHLAMNLIAVSGVIAEDWRP